VTLTSSVSDLSVPTAQNPPMRWTCFYGLILLALLASSPSVARDDDKDHELAHQLLQEGRILPLAKIVEAVSKEIPGEMLEVEFEVEDEGYIYELKILRPDGKVQEVEVDAASGRILKIEDDD
jgi:uncharacterized membrane protein YkoI